MKKLSVALATFNEEKNIKECLKSVQWADELIVVDGSSTDGTAEAARMMGAKVYVVPNQSLMKKNMNLAFSKCHGDWILSLDADERVTASLQKEISQVATDDGPHDAYRLPRKNIIFGKWITHTGWYPDYQTRLFRKGQAKFPAKNVHEELLVDGSIGVLESAIEHLHYTSVSQWISKMDSYTTVEADKLIRDGRKMAWTDCIRFPFQEFLSRFFDREGYRDGLHGLVLSILMAFYWEVIFVKVWEREGFWQYGDDRFLKDVTRVGRNVGADYGHWLMVTERNPVRRYAKKLKNKVGSFL